MSSTRSIFIAGVLSAISSSALGASDCDDISAKVCSLVDGYNPRPGDGYSPPTCLGASNHAGDIQGAFSVAHDKLKNELCRIKKIFVMTDMDSWGKWENPRLFGHPPGDSYIAVNTNVIGLRLSVIQDGHLSHLPQRLDAYGRHDTDDIGGGKRPEDVGLLAVLAHEIGHIKWNRDNIPWSLGCFQHDFIQASWSGPGDSIKASTWTTFGEDFGTHVAGGPPKPNAVRNSADLLQIYNNGFVTVLAAASPEEDFVETYTVAALMNSHLTDLKIDIGGQKVQVNSNRTNAVLRAKFACVANLLN